MKSKVISFKNSELNKKISNRRKVIRLLEVAPIEYFCSMHFICYKWACFQTKNKAN